MEDALCWWLHLGSMGCWFGHGGWRCSCVAANQGKRLHSHHVAADVVFRAGLSQLFV